ncbi:MAG: TonB-dependent receptor [Muribaculaceae bacterium]|nr:TonB-dependent receptor [Muribaculaceae bacterium]
MKKNILLALVGLMLTCVFASANATINGIVVDASDTTELIGATVRLLRATTDSTLVKGTATDEHGVFDIKGVKAGKYVLKFSYLGYTDVMRHVTIGADGRDVNLGVVSMSPNTVMLKETTVIGVKTPITVKEDTIEYNADTYKTQANAVVEDLLKRLPGVEVGSDGKITANGKEVKKILIDGKEFFADDPTVASKNIPAEMVNKLQVIDRKSDLARLTGVDDGEDETVINLTVKKGMNNGWFGTVNAGYGTDNRYAFSLMANHFNDGNQFTILGGGNNTNSLGFTDGGAQRFQRFGGDRGITKSQNVGINFNVGSKEDEHFRVGGDLMYSHSDRDTRTRTARQYLFADSTSYYDAQQQARDKGNNLRGDFRLKWEIDTLNTIDIRPNFSLNFSRSTSAEVSQTRAGDAALSLVNQSLNNYRNKGNSYEFGTWMVFNHKVASHPGRSMSVNLRYNHSNVEEDGNTYTRNNYYSLGTDETIDQVYDNDRITNSVGGRLSWTEPIGKVQNARFFEASYRANYRYSKADKNVYDITRGATPDPTGAGGDLALPYNPLYSPVLRQQLADAYDPSVLTDMDLLTQVLEQELGPELSRDFNTRLSNSFRNKFYDGSLMLGFRQVRKAYNLNLGFSVQHAMSSSRDRINSARDIPTRWAWSAAPYARFRYKFSSVKSMNIDYRMRATQPSIAQLQPVADESNPLNIVTGNPELKATFTHRFSVRFQDFAQMAQRSIMAMFNLNYEQNSIISRTDYDQSTGGRFTTYENVNGVWSAMAMNMMSFPFGSQKTWYFSSHLFSRFAVSKGYNNAELNRSNSFNINYSPGIAFRNSQFDLELRPRYNFQTTHNTVQTGSNRNVHTYGGQFNGTWSMPCGLVLSTDLNFSSTSGYSAGYDTKQWLWNASLAYQFLRDKAAAITLSVYDILGQKKSIYRNVTGNYIEDVAYNSLTRYGLVTFTYRFTTFKKGEQPKLKDDDFSPGGRGPGGPGGRPGGFNGPRRW